ncbi:MAG: 2-C-methyl-D-erythritol 4-phosphate cytidylyltransferase, partial [Candidatus Omnitrophica bacterium]|nr:2-C-methyl-D-erythritol 4-phosphate cytidylyltransferase [Candidatus Omnitrophota bacterium]
MKITAVIPAAGRGKRLGGKKDKVFVLLGDKPVLFYTLRVLESSKLIDEIILVIGPRYLNYVKNVFLPKFRFTKVKKVTSGGRTRAISVSKGLSLLSQDTDLVLIHDGARPFIDKYIIEKIVKEAIKSGAAVSGVPVKSTVKRVRDKKIEETVERRDLWEIQTPQVFKKDILLRCYKEAKREKFSPTDDAQILER